MAILKYDSQSDEWCPRTKEEVMRDADCEGNRPCDKCWEMARDHGIYAFHLKLDKTRLKRCSCGRMIGVVK